ncbi:MAG TPA: hypothetical protein VGP72_29495 [Planctomycetota bacterium]|jgi:hypothetical protein
MTETEHSLEKWVAPCGTQEEVREAAAQAVDYRGDITLTLKDGQEVTGYVFNLNTGCNEPFLDIFPNNADAKQRVNLKDVMGVAFSGQDMAVGRSWKAWKERKEKEQA